MTAQFHEQLILNGTNTSMASCPPLPENDPRILPATEDEKAQSGLINCTACWRGYVGTWEIRTGRLYLVGLDGAFKLLDGQFLFADWVSGTLRVPQGKQLQYVHMGFQSVYEQEQLIHIENGLVTSMTTIDNRAQQPRKPLVWFKKLARRNK